MRSLNSLKNVSTSIGITLVMCLLGFFTRKLFLDSLGEQYLGLNGLLTNVIGMLSLVESGLGVSIVYNLYKPLAQGDTRTVISLVQLYRKAYRCIAGGIGVLSILLYPFLTYLIDEGADIPYLPYVYAIFVGNTIIGYLMADKLSLLSSDQKRYKIAGINLGYQVIIYLLKIVILMWWPNYILFIGVEFVMSAVYNLLVRHKIVKLYPYIRTKEKIPVAPETKRNIITNVKALFFSTIGSYLIYSTDNILISSFVGLSIVGLYSNYTLIITQVKSMANNVIAGVKDSVGHLVGSEGEDKQYQLFKVLFFVNFVIIAYISILLYCMLNPFITWWLGNEYIFSDWVVAIICANVYIDLIRSASLTFKVVSGIFVPDRYLSFIAGIINLAVSLLLVRHMGLSGILLGTSVAYLSTNTWFWPHLIYKHNFKRSPVKYYVRYIAYLGLALALTGVCLLVNGLLFTGQQHLGGLALMGLTDTAVVFGILWLIFRSTPEYKYLGLMIAAIRKK